MGEVSPGIESVKEQAFQRAARLTCSIGVAFAILFVIGMIMIGQVPTFDASESEVIAFYQDPSHQIIHFGALYVMPLSAIAFLWFVATLHAWVELSGRPIDKVMSTVQMLAGVSFVTLALAAAAAAVVASFAVDQYVITPDLARQFPIFGRTLLVVFGMRMAALFVTSTAKLGQSSGLLPGWFLGASTVVAVVLFVSASLNVWLTILFPAWVLLLCAMIWLRGVPALSEPRELRPDAESAT